MHWLDENRINFQWVEDRSKARSEVVQRLYTLESYLESLPSHAREAADETIRHWFQHVMSHV